MPRRMALESRATRVGNLGAFWEAWGMASEVRGRVQWFFRRTRASSNSPMPHNQPRCVPRPRHCDLGPHTLRHPRLRFVFLQPGRKIRLAPTHHRQPLPDHALRRLLGGFLSGPPALRPPLLPLRTKRGELRMLYVQALRAKLAAGEIRSARKVAQVVHLHKLVPIGLAFDDQGVGVLVGLQ